MPDLRTLICVIRLLDLFLQNYAGSSCFSWVTRKANREASLTVLRYWE